MKILKPIAFKRLRDTSTAGNFTIKCETNIQFIHVQGFFETSKDNIRFKDLLAVGETKAKRLSQVPYAPYFPLLISGDKRLRFVIKYENLNELLKLREIFNIRGGKFDMYLVEKRDYNPFNEKFFTRLTEPVKVIKK
jgi:hypothetical protein